MIAGLFPASQGLPDGALTSIQSLASSVLVFNEIIALDVLWTCIKLIIYFDVLLLGINLVRYGLRLTPFVGNKA